MPFRSETIRLSKGEPKPVKLRSGDCHVTLSCATSAPRGDVGDPGVMSFYVGGPEIRKDGGGLFCGYGSYTTDVDGDDELWVAVTESTGDWQADDQVTITALIRSAAKTAAPRK